MNDDWRDKPHVHAGTDCGGGPDCPARETPAVDTVSAARAVADRAAHTVLAGVLAGDAAVRHG